MLRIIEFNSAKKETVEILRNIASLLYHNHKKFLISTDNLKLPDKIPQFTGKFRIFFELSLFRFSPRYSVIPFRDGSISFSTGSPEPYLENIESSPLLVFRWVRCEDCFFSSGKFFNHYFALWYNARNPHTPDGIPSIDWFENYTPVYEKFVINS